MRSDVEEGRREANDLAIVIEALRSGRDTILQDWVGRTRDNAAITSDEPLSDPLLLDHLPQLFDAIIDRLEANRPRAEAEQFAAVHGFTRRISGYDLLETTIELMMFRHAIWAHLLARNLASGHCLSAMEAIDGMVDRAVISSLRAFLDPGAGMLVRKSANPSGTTPDPLA
jgi:hypothetical protein